MSKQTEANYKPLREREYRLFLMWKSLPVDFTRGGREHLLSTGIDDEELLILADIKTQKEFAAKFDLNETTLVKWKKAPVPVEYRELDWRYWAKKLTPRVIGYLFEGIKAEKDAGRIKLWLQSVDGFVEESRVNSDVSTETLKGVRELADMMIAGNPNPQPSAPPDESSETDAENDDNVDFSTLNVEKEGVNVGNDTDDRNADD